MDNFDINLKIDKACDKYETALRAGADFDVVKHIRSFPSDHQPRLLSELLLLAKELVPTTVLADLVETLKVRLPEHQERIEDCLLNGGPGFDSSTGGSAVGRPNHEASNRSGGNESRSSGTSPDSAGRPAESDGPRRLGALFSAPDCPDKIGNYEPIRILGRGGMGVVYLAQQTQPIERQVALKIIRPGLDSEKVIARFEMERNALAMMNHKNIAKVLDAGLTEAGSPYFVMEWVDGLPLLQYVKERQLTLEDKLRLIIEICEGIEHAHQKGVIHRDLKPSNVIVTTEQGIGIPKIIDFGLAKATGNGVGSSMARLTEAGQMLGTVQYMSPEQAQLGAQDIDTRTDIYSIGIILFQLITGVTPLREDNMEGRSLPQILQLIQRIEPEKPSRLVKSAQTFPGPDAASHSTRTERRRIEGELDWIVLKCLSQERERRYASASQLADDLSNFLADRPVLARPSSTYYRVLKLMKRNFGYTILVAALLITLVAATGLSLALAARADYARRQSEVATQRALNTVQSIQELVLDSPVWKVNNPGRNALIDLLASEYQFWADDTTGSHSNRRLIAENLIRLAKNDREMGRIDRSLRLANEAIELCTLGQTQSDPKSVLLICAANAITIAQPGDPQELISRRVQTIEERLDRLPWETLPLELAILKCDIWQSMADTCFRARNSGSFRLGMKSLNASGDLLKKYPQQPDLRLLQARAMSRVAISISQGVGEDEAIKAAKDLDVKAFYREAIAEATDLIKKNHRPATTAKFMSGAINNLGLRLVNDYSDNLASRDEVINNYQTGLAVCQGLLKQYPDNLTFIEASGLLTSNLAAAHETFCDWEVEEALRQEADEQLGVVVGQVGVESRAAERFALNRIHHCLNQLNLQEHEEARRLAWDLYQWQMTHQQNVLERVPREYFHKLIFSQLLLDLPIMANEDRQSERQALQEDADELFELAVNTQQFRRDKRWLLLTNTDLFNEYRDVPKYQYFWSTAQPPWETQETKEPISGDVD